MAINLVTKFQPYVDEKFAFYQAPSKQYCGNLNEKVFEKPVRDAERAPLAVAFLVIISSLKYFSVRSSGFIFPS